MNQFGSNVLLKRSDSEEQIVYESDSTVTQDCVIELHLAFSLARTQSFFFTMPFSELYFNVDNGYLEGLVRGFKAGILSQADYLNLVQCETLEGESNVCVGC